MLPFVLCCTETPRDASGGTEQPEVASAARPRFESYPVDSIYHGRIAPVNLRSARGAREFRTVLREGAAGPADFAGHYRVVEWGCGSPCHTFAIVESSSGRVVMPGLAAMSGIAYRADSRLLVVEPPEDVVELCEEEWMKPICEGVYSYYYLWDGSHLALIDSVLVDSTVVAARRAAPNGR